MVSSGTFMNCPDWNIPFTIYNNAADKQFGAGISQDVNPAAFFLIRLTKTQQKYTTT